MRRTRLTTTLVAAAAVTFGLVSPVAMADEATDIWAASSTATENRAGGDGGSEDEEPDTMFGSSVEQTAMFKEVMSWGSVVGALLAAIVKATVMIAQINPAILNPLKDLLKQAGVKF
ncbi:hypothetical protein [Corynebacterium confusum]|uniref:hypothetical protein n=1 Tax=Corynebacterium confusum TaxID=71254 RepID=UPI0025B2F6DB|nr:hypothetical protein [Corynebacterium confusum]WJY90063.1 hypothetical protein CCONF_07705 [Corynebacterium confusum]